MLKDGIGAEGLVHRCNKIPWAGVTRSEERAASPQQQATNLTSDKYFRCLLQKYAADMNAKISWRYKVQKSGYPIS